MENFPPAMPPDQADEFRRRRRGRNWVTLIALLALAMLFFAITLVKMARP